MTTVEKMMTTAEEMMIANKAATKELLRNIEDNLRSHFDSIQVLLAYIKEIETFDNYKTVDKDEEHEKKYPYQIPLEIWNNTMHLQIMDGISLEFADGAIFVDRYFDSDYRDYDMPTRYVYIYRTNA